MFLSSNILQLLKIELFHIIKISIKQILYRVSSQQNLVLFSFLLLFLYFFFFYFYCWFYWGTEWADGGMIQQSLPINILQPNMLLKLLRSIKPQSIRGFPLNRLINKVCRLDRPSRRDIIFLDCDLLRQYLISDFLP